MLELVVASTITTFATGIGALPVIALGARAEGLRPLLLGIAGGVMAVAAIAGLLIPAARDGQPLEVVAGLVTGIAFLFAARRALGHRRVHAHVWITGGRVGALVFAVLLVHSLPEGFAIGSAYASSTEELGLFIAAAIAIQNVPEGTSVALPLASEGASGSQLFWAAVASSSPQVPGAVIAYLLVGWIAAILPFSFAFAGGAMLALVVVELGPEALRGDPMSAVLGFTAGAGALLALSAVLEV